MIKYALVCDKGHGFESWFPDSDSFDQQARRGLVDCPRCGSTSVSKALMAPSVSTSKRKARNAAPEAASPPSGAQPVALMDDKQRALRDAIRELHAKIAETSVDVGQQFAAEARRMHDGETPTRAIRGQATIAQARELWEDGVPVLPIPQLPDDRN
ncbi:MAG: hypothetical protein JWN93_2959 [Hyphomicrobiales bacterium]|jgi:hypothetical protein|nr:hypothetical protein [Hyphomicrobiales bacterium]